MALPLSYQSVKIRPIPTGIVDWKTIAPLMLPSARASLPSRTQKKLLTFSGSSVASGARTRARTRASTPMLSAMLEQLFDEEVGAADHRPEADQELQHAERQRRVGAALEAAVEEQRVERLLPLHLAAAAQGAGGRRAT